MVDLERADGVRGDGRQLELMKEAGLDGWMLWARFGLEMEYLGHEFMTKFRFAVQESPAGAGGVDL